MDEDEQYEAEKELGIDLYEAFLRFHDGFDSNKIAKKIIKEAKRDAYLFRPKQKLEKGQPIYDKTYESNRKGAIVIASIIGLIILRLCWKLLDWILTTRKTKDRTDK